MLNTLSSSATNQGWCHSFGGSGGTATPGKPLPQNSQLIEQYSIQIDVYHLP